MANFPPWGNAGFSPGFLQECDPQRTASWLRDRSAATGNVGLRWTDYRYRFHGCLATLELRLNLVLVECVPPTLNRAVKRNYPNVCWFSCRVQLDWSAVGFVGEPVDPDDQ
jgi:hypothetical protein